MLTTEEKENLEARLLDLNYAGATIGIADIKLVEVRVVIARTVTENDTMEIVESEKIMKSENKWVPFTYDPADGELSVVGFEAVIDHLVSEDT